jgi:hypothetical protein
MSIQALALHVTGLRDALERLEENSNRTITQWRFCMKVQGKALKSCMMALGFAGIALISPSGSLAADAEMKVEVTITDQGYNVKGHTTPGSLTAVIVRNQGSTTHGISSPLFKSGVVKKEGDGVEVRGPKGKGFRAYHLEPGQTMTLYFSKASTSDPATGISETSQVPFWCDIHTHMKGEFLVVETRGEIGGG